MGGALDSWQGRDKWFLPALIADNSIDGFDEDVKLLLSGFLSIAQFGNSLRGGLPVFTRFCAERADFGHGLFVRELQPLLGLLELLLRLLQPLSGFQERTAHDNQVTDCRIVLRMT